MEQNFRVNYNVKDKIFEVVFHDEISERTVRNCHKAFAELFDQYHDGGYFKFLLDTRGFKPQTPEAHHLIRKLFDTRNKTGEPNKCIAAAAVNESVKRIRIRNSYNSDESEKFFWDIQEAMDWLSGFKC